MTVVSSIRRNRSAAAGLACIVLCAAGQAARADSDPRFDQFRDTAAHAIGLKRCDLVHLRVGNDPTQPMQVVVPIGGQERTFSLHPHSVRGPNFHLLEQRADGKVYEVKAPPEVTVRGTVDNNPDSIVAGGVMPEGPEEGLHATAILADGTQYWIQPVSQWVAGAPRGLYAIYTQDDVLAGPWHCGNDNAGGTTTTSDSGRFNDRGATLYTAQLSTDADFEYFARYGGTGQVNSKISTLLNIIDVQYERETDITMVLATQLVRTAEPDPYGSTDSGTLLNNFRDDWNNNRPGSRADLNQLFTGKEVDGNTIGLAFVGVVCGSSAYGIVQSDFNNNLMSATDLSAHESGHNWSASHCTCSGNGSTVSTMNPFITSINRFTFSNDTNTVGQIVAHRNSRGCLTTGGGGTDPRNNDCASAVPVGPGLIGWNNAGATNDGPACGSFGADIWYTYVAPCDGDITINTCGSNHDTMLAVYTGFCGSLTQVGCNDDASGCGGTGLQSAIPTFAGTRGTTYFIRLGGFNGATGDGLLSISQGFCPAPSNDSCGSAITVQQGDTPFSTIGASTDGPVETSLCNNAGDAQLDNDVWFRYVAPCSGTVRVSTCGATFDSKIAIYTGCPSGPNTAIACNDDNGPGCSGTRSSVDFASTFGTAYIIRVGGFADSVGTGSLNVASLSCPPPGNDNCGNAFALFGVSGSGFNGTVVGATNDGAATCGSSTSGPDVWYTFTAPCDGQFNFTTCGSHDIAGVDTGMDSVVSIHSGCPGTSANVLACNDDNGVCGSLDTGAIRDSSVTISMTSGQNVLVRVATFANSLPPQPFRYNFSFTSPAPANDDCASAQAVGNGSFPYCTVGATNSPEQPNCRPASNDVWFRYTAPCTGTARASLCGSSYDTFLIVYDSGSCAGTATALVCNDDSGPACSGLQSSGDFPVVGGSSYLVRVAGFSLNAGGGTLTLSCTPAVGNGACCCGSTCMITTSAACTGSFLGGACNPAGNNTAPCCKADYNHSGAISVQDIFDFLSGYFSNNPCADPNSSGTISVQDIFDFLAAYFAGGC